MVPTGFHFPPACFTRSRTATSAKATRMRGRGGSRRARRRASRRNWAASSMQRLALGGYQSTRSRALPHRAMRRDAETVTVAPASEPPPRRTLMALTTLMQGPLPVTAPLVLNPLMARMVENAGFPAGYLGGGATGYQKVSLEAHLNVTEMCQAAIDMHAVSSLPLILDGACGYGDPMHMHRTIGMSEAAGFAAIEIEDQLVPKRAHHHVGIEHMIPMELMAAKVKEAVSARRHRDFLIIARTNAMRASTMDDALCRGEAYRKAGADVLLLSMAHKPEQLRAIGERLGGPLMYLTARGGLAGTGMTLKDLGALGFKIVADPQTPLLAAYTAWKKVYQDLADGL